MDFVVICAGNLNGGTDLFLCLMNAQGELFLEELSEIALVKVYCFNLRLPAALCVQDGNRQPLTK